MGPLQNSEDSIVGEKQDQELELLEIHPLWSYNTSQIFSVFLI